MAQRRMPNNVPSNLQQTVAMTIRKQLSPTTYSVHLHGTGAQGLASTKAISSLANGTKVRGVWRPDIRQYVIEDTGVLGGDGDIDIWMTDAWPIIAGSEDDEFADHEPADLVVGSGKEDVFDGLMGWAVGSQEGFSNPPYQLLDAEVPGARPDAMAFNPAGTVFVLQSIASKTIQAWEWIPGVGFGNEYPRGTVSQFSGPAVQFSPDGNYVAVGLTLAPWVEVFNWSDTTGFGSLVSDPAVTPTGDVEGIEWSPDGAYIACAHDTTPFLTVYNWSAGFGSKIANPSVLPAGGGALPRWHPNQSYLALGSNSTPYVEAWNWSAGFGAKVANPSTLPNSGPVGMDWDLGGTALVYVDSLNENVFVYAWSSGFGSLVTTAFGTATDYAHGSRFSVDKSLLAVNSNLTPFLHVYNFVGGVLGTKLTAPATPMGQEIGLHVYPVWTPASAGAPNGWTEFDFGSTLVITEEEYGLSLLQATAAAEQIAGVYKTVPAGDFTIWCKTSLLAELAANASAGLVLLEDGTLSTGDMVTLSLGYNATTITLSVDVWTAYNAFSSASKSVTVTLLSDAYLRIRRAGTTYYFDVSTNGIGWIEIYTGTISFVPAEFGLYVNNDNTGQDIRAAHQFFRYLPYDIGVDGVVNGDRISLFRNV